jgi:hypothetical protein
MAYTNQQQQLFEFNSIKQDLLDTRTTLERALEDRDSAIGQKFIIQNELKVCSKSLSKYKPSCLFSGAHFFLWAGFARGSEA